MKHPLFFFPLCVLLCACGNSTNIESPEKEAPVSDTNALIAAVERNLAQMDEMPPEDIEDDTRYNLAYDLLDTLVDLVNIYHVDLSRFDALDHTETPDHKVSFYSFHLNCFSPNPPAYSIIVWNTPSGKRAQKWVGEEHLYKMYEINPDKGLYLLLLSEKLSGSEYQNTAQVIQISANALNTDYHAFEEGTRLSIHNGLFSYDPQSKMLSCESLNPEENFSFDQKFDGNRFQPTDTLPENLAQQLRSFFSCKSLSQLNRFIDPELGLTILYSNGSNEDYTRWNRLVDSSTAYSYAPNPPHWVTQWLFQCIDFKNVKIDDFQSAYTPVFHRETILREGAFIDQSQDQYVMSTAIKRLVREVWTGPEHADFRKKLKKDLAFYKELEKNSMRVVITDKKSPAEGGKIRVFHFYERCGRLILFLIDFYSFDGSV